MHASISSAQSRVKVFAQENPIMLGAFFFLLFSGIAAGIHSLNNMEGETALLDGVRQLPELLHGKGVSWAYLMGMSLLIHGLLASMLLLSGIWLPTCVFWGISILLRGLFTGCVLGLIGRSWSTPSAVALLLLLLLDVALMLPVLLQLSAITKSQMLIAWKQLFGLPHKTQTVQDCFSLFLRACLGLLPCIAIESLIMPLVLYIFC